MLGGKHHARHWGRHTGRAGHCAQFLAPRVASSGHQKVSLGQLWESQPSCKPNGEGGVHTALAPRMSRLPPPASSTPDTFRHSPSCLRLPSLHPAPRISTSYTSQKPPPLPSVLLLLGALGSCIPSSPKASSLSAVDSSNKLSSESTNLLFKEMHSMVGSQIRQQIVSDGFSQKPSSCDPLTVPSGDIILDPETTAMCGNEGIFPSFHLEISRVTFGL